MVATDVQKGPRESGGLGGDPDAFQELVGQHQRMIHCLCYRMTGSAADAEDLAQETFIHAYQHLDSFRGDAQFSSWLYRIAVNQCLNWKKGNARREKLHREWGEQVGCSPATSHDGVWQVQNALMHLNPKQRAAVVLTTYDGLTHAEAAQALGCSETTISWRLFTARRRLKRLLAGRKRTEGPNE